MPYKLGILSIHDSELHVYDVVAWGLMGDCYEFETRWSGGGT